VEPTLVTILLIIAATPIIVIGLVVAIWVGIKFMFGVAVALGTFAAVYIGIICAMYLAEALGFLPAGITAEFWNQTVLLFDQAVQMINDARIYK